MHDASPRSADRYVPFKQEGWGIALFIVFLALTAAGVATYVHKTTYLHPTDTHFRAAGTAQPTGSHE